MFEASVSTHRKVIAIIGGKWPHGEPFAIWEVRDASDCSVSSIIRAVRVLMRAGYIKHAKRAYRGRYYRVTPRWTTIEEVIEAFAYTKILGI